MRVLIIFDSRYGAQPDADLADAVWLVESPENRSLATRLWSGGNSGSAITIFRSSSDELGAHEVLKKLDDVDLHHPDWTEIGVIGFELSPALARELHALGLSSMAIRSDFVVRRNRPA